jgi:hypothetical protein
MLLYRVLAQLGHDLQPQLFLWKQQNAVRQHVCHENNDLRGGWYTKNSRCQFCT